MPKHTRKPHLTEEGTPHIYAEWNGKRVVLATVQTPEWHESQVSGSREAYANAVLYAAALDMLAALHSLVEGIDVPESNCSCHISPPCSDCVEHGHVREALEQAQAAIAKAEGRSA
jgi:hypothetical protein